MLDKYGFDKPTQVKALQDLETKQLITRTITPSKRIHYKINGENLIHTIKCELIIFKNKEHPNATKIAKYLNALFSSTMCVMFMPPATIEYLYPMIKQHTKRLNPDEAAFLDNFENCSKENQDVIRRMLLLGASAAKDEAQPGKKTHPKTSNLR
jgi:hypothetical protein